MMMPLDTIFPFIAPDGNSYVGRVDLVEICRRADLPVDTGTCIAVHGSLSLFGYRPVRERYFPEIAAGDKYEYEMRTPTPFARGSLFRGTFRIDDVSLNTDLARLQAIVAVVRSRLPRARFLLAISPLVHDLSAEPEAEQGRIFPRILNAHSDHRVFFRVDRAGLPYVSQEVQEAYFPDIEIIYDYLINASDITPVSHGLLHVDHRLLDRGQQEMSILISCSLAKSKIFVPPFNKWNAATEEICREHGIELVKWEDGWKHAGHNGFDPAHDRYYLHEHDTTAEQIGAWIDAGLEVRT